MTDAVSVENLIKIYTSGFGRNMVQALKELSFSIQQGTVYGLLGPNGSGKTTTLRILLGLEAPDKGKASILGNPAGSRKARQSTGYLSEENRLMEWLSPLEILDFFAGMRGLKGVEKKNQIGELVEQLGISEYSKRPVGTLSKGMTRRVGIASALMGNPDVLLLDEPTSGLDPIWSRKIKDIIKDRVERGATVLVCSHQLLEMEKLCSEAAIINKGMLLKKGSMAELLNGEKSLEDLFLDLVLNNE